MRNSGIRVHKRLLGDTKQCLQWVPFAEHLVDGLIDRAKGAASNFLAQQARPAEGVLVHVSISGGEKFITIQVEPPCSDKEGYLLSRSGPANQQVYKAHFVDGVSEPIVPSSGSPRPDPETQDRTIGFKVPPELFAGNFQGTPASKYSGQMRKVVGCYYSSGRQNRFAHTHTKTHGIVTRTTNINNVLVTSDWLVEISSLGVYAVRMPAPNKCCDGWDITPFLPTKKELEDFPAWTQYKVELSLWWAKEHGARTAVHNVIGNMAEPYDDGTPWSLEQGWAFSASGNEVMQVFAAANNDPESHFDMSRWTITFGDDGQGHLTAVLTPNERKVPFTPLLQNEVWIPTDPVTWTGINAFPAGGSEVAFYPTQDCPIHVYYDGEEAIITRWSLTKETVPAFTTPTFGSVTWDTLRVFNDEPETLVTCQALTHGQTNWTNNTEGGIGLKTPAYTLYTAGYHNNKQSHIFGRYNFNGDRAVTTVEHPSEVLGETTNSGALDPSCYFVRDVPPPTLITGCTNTFSNITHVGIAWMDLENYDEFGDGKVSVVLFGEEREAILFVWEQTFLQEGTRQVGLTQNPGYRAAWTETKIDGGDCPFTDTTYVPGFTQIAGGVIFPTYNDIFSTDTVEGGAQLDLGGRSYNYVATIGPLPLYDWDNFNLGTFLEWNITTKTTADSNVFAMHGNLYYDNPSLTPSLQRDNAVYLLDNDVVTVGGFGGGTINEEILGFIGKA